MYKTLDECAKACWGISSMFTYGTNDYGEKKCGTQGCPCWCETATKEGTCQMIDATGYNLYKYIGGNKKAYVYILLYKSFRAIKSTRTSFTF